MSCRKRYFVLNLIFLAVLFSAFRLKTDAYKTYYGEQINALEKEQDELLRLISSSNLKTESEKQKIIEKISDARRSLKSLDFFFRYFEPNAYRKLNGPLPVEWETEVFEKFEKPYRREGAGLLLAETYLQEKEVKKDSLQHLISSAQKALQTFRADTIVANLNSGETFFFCNRLFLLNLASIYTTGYECPAPERTIAELKEMLQSVRKIYSCYQQSFAGQPLNEQYLALYDQLLEFMKTQKGDVNGFDHFHFIRDYVNPLFALNQQMMAEYKIKSSSNMDYSLNSAAQSIFDKNLFRAQQTKGIYRRMNEEKDLALLHETGRKLFYDPLLSGNNRRSCASCHKPGQFYTDTAVTTPVHYDRQQNLARNAPSLVNAPHNHLLMMDGKHLGLQEQAIAVMCNSSEMGSKEKELIEKIKSCKEYEAAFKKLVRYTPQQKALTMEHIASAITFYYGSFSFSASPFDEMMNKRSAENKEVTEGFNLFMGKAQCATCHFVPGFSGIKPPFVGNEFEVIGVPATKDFAALSADSGRYKVHAAAETKNAFRTTTVRNAARTKPYMHNGVFKSLEEVIDFYDAGGGTGKKLKVENQTLSGDSLKLSQGEKQALILFIRSLTESIDEEGAPQTLPLSKNKSLNFRKPGGEY